MNRDASADDSADIASVMAAEEALVRALRKERRLFRWAGVFVALAAVNFVAAVALNAWVFHQLQMALAKGEYLEVAMAQMQKMMLPVRILSSTLIAFVIAAIGLGIIWLVAVRRRRRGGLS